MSEIFDTIPGPGAPGNAAPLGPGLPGTGGGVTIVSPVQTTPLSSATRQQLNTVATSASARQQQIAGDREILPIVYGTVRLGALVVVIVDYATTYLMVLAAFAYGPNEALDEFYVGNDPVDPGVVITTYLGTAAGAVDPGLVSAFAAKGLTYADALPYVTYAVLIFPSGAGTGFPQISARITGRKVFDDRDVGQAFITPSTWTHSSNPTLCLADFIRCPWGMNRGITGVEPATVIAAAYENDALLGFAASRTLNLALDKQQPAKAWIAALRTYANVWVQPIGGNQEAFKFIIDQDGATAMSFNQTNIKQLSMNLKVQSMRNVPTVVEVIYTDTTTVPYRDASAFSPENGEPLSGEPFRLSQVRLPGINNYAEAYRAAVERYNDLRMGNLTGTHVAFDSAATLEIGDLITVTDPIGLSTLRARIVKPVLVSAGRYSIDWREFDASKYSTAVSTGSPFPNWWA